jgi:hypothetical protein
VSSIRSRLRSRMRSRMRSRTSRFVVLALAASTLAVDGLDQGTEAQALEGRRLRMHVDGENDGSAWRLSS